MKTIENPIREHIKLDNQWYVRRERPDALTVFVPAPWAGKPVELRGAGAMVLPPLHFGDWTELPAPGNPPPGAALVAGEPAQIRRLEAAFADERTLSVRVTLAGTGPFDLLFTLTTLHGRLSGRLDVTVGRATRDLSVEMPFAAAVTGPCRLKATLAVGDQVVDNARIDVGA